MNHRSSLAMIFSLLCLWACGPRYEPETSLTAGTSSQDPVFSTLRQEFSTSASAVPTDALRLGRDLQCLYQWGVADQFVTGLFTIRFNTMAGFTTGEVTFEDLAGINLIFTTSPHGLVAQVAAFPGVQLSSPIQAYVRTSEASPTTAPGPSETALTMEWTIHSAEFFREVSPSGGPLLRNASFVTDESIADTTRRVIFYAHCQ